MRALRTTRFLSVLALAATALVIGCGGDDGDDVNNNADRYEGQEAEVAALVDDFGDAGRDGDGTRVCEEIFTAELTKNVEREAGQSCPSEVEENLPEGEYELEVDTIELNGDAATVGVTDQDDNKSVLHVEKVDADWRVARVSPAA